jgi:hypothetical protein
MQETTFESGMNIYEFLPWLGLVGFFITVGESVLINNEVDKIINEYSIDSSLILLACGFAVTLVIFTSISPFFIKRCSASMFNIALVSQIFWSYIVEIISGEESARGYENYVGFVIIIIGIYLFNKYPVNYLNKSEQVDESINSQDRKATLIGNQSETSSCSAFSPPDKYTYLKNNTLSHRANKLLNNQ